MIERKIYTILGLLRDVGGLWGALSGISSGITFILTFNGLYQLLTSRLYRVNYSEGSFRQGQSFLQRVILRQQNKKMREEKSKEMGISQY